MAYSLIDQQTLDLDLFCRDSQKCIHIASGGGKIPDQLAEDSNFQEAFSQQVRAITGNLEVELNPYISEIKGTTSGQYSHEIDLSDFIAMASRGFYSYDKFKVGDFEDPQFYLVAKPKFKPQDIIPGTEGLLKAAIDLPDDFSVFDLFDCFKKGD